LAYPLCKVDVKGHRGGLLLYPLSRRINFRKKRWSGLQKNTKRCGVETVEWFSATPQRVSGPTVRRIWYSAIEVHRTFSSIWSEYRSCCETECCQL